MGLFDFFVDPVSKWSRDAGLLVDVELREGSLCGAKLGSRCSALSRLGPTSNPKPAKTGYYAWNDLGIDVYSSNDILETFSLNVDHTAFEPEDTPFKGRFLLDGKPLPLGIDTRKEDVLRLLGEPWYQLADPDDDEIALTFWYETRTLEWTFEFLPKGTLATVILSSPPDLAEESMRRNLGCEKSWPP